MDGNMHQKCDASAMHCEKWADLDETWPIWSPCHPNYKVAFSHLSFLFHDAIGLWMSIVLQNIAALTYIYFILFF